MAYRVYTAMFLFEARDETELSMDQGDTLIVQPGPSGEWPNPERWIRGTNQRTNKTGEFPGTYVEFVKEYTPEEPPPSPTKAPTPPPRPRPSKSSSVEPPANIRASYKRACVCVCVRMCVCVCRPTCACVRVYVCAGDGDLVRSMKGTRLEGSKRMFVVVRITGKCSPLDGIHLHITAGGGGGGGGRRPILF